MPTAATSAPQSKQWAQILDGYMHLHQLLSRASSADPNGPYGKAMADAEKALNWLVSQRSSDSQTSDPQAAAAQFPAAYSSDQISPDVQGNPTAYLQDGDHGSIHCQNFVSDSSGDGSDTACDPSSDGGTVDGYQDQFYADTADQQTSDSGGVSSQSSGDTAGSPDGGTIQSYTPAFRAAVADRRADVGVSDRRSIITDPSVESGTSRTSPSGATVTVTQNPDGTTSIVRDHRGLPPVAPPPAFTASAASSGGTAFTSAATFAELDTLKANSDAAEQYALDHPDDPEAAQRAQDASMSYQLKKAQVSQDAAIAAQEAMNALKASKLNV